MKQKGHDYKITAVKYYLNNNDTMEDLLVKVKEKYPLFDISRRHLSRLIKDNNITLKITRVRHEPIKRFGKDIDITPTKKKNETKTQL